MPGRRSIEGFDFITPRRDYRVNVTAADSSVESVTIPVLPTNVSPARRNYPGGGGFGGEADSTAYGRNAQLMLALLLEGFTSVDLELWLEATDDEILVQDPSSSSISPGTLPVLPTTGAWVRVAALSTVTFSQLWTVKDIPPGNYKVRVASVSGTGNISIREQHAA
jgi:hypothetical protein